MRDIKKIYGKRVKSAEAVKMRVGHPESNQVETLPPGKPSGKINSYIRGEYFEITPPSGKKNLYIKDGSHIEIVEPDAKDESFIGAGLISGALDLVGNKTERAGKWAGWIGDATKKEITDLGDNFSLFGKDLQKIVLALTVAVGVVIIFKVWKL